MNPGPAPRPPTDRPRVNTPSIVSTVSSVPTSFSQMTLTSPSTTPTLSIFPNSSTLSLSQKSGQGGVAVIKEGYVRCKEDKFLASWNQRYLVLREFKLEFLKNETGKVVISIPLNTITNVARSEDTRMAFEITRIANPKDVNNRAALVSRDIATKTITCEVKSDDEIYEWIDKIYERCPGMGGVSNPTNFSHRVHVGFDPHTGAFVGLPAEWEKLLTASAITKEDYKKNPQAVIEVLEFYSDIQRREQDPQYMGPGYSPTQRSGQSSPAQRPAMQRNETSQSQRQMGEMSPSPSQRKASDADRTYASYQQGSKEMPDAEQKRRMDEEARRIRDMQRQREEEQNRREQEAYNASIPKTRTPIAQQELGGYGGGRTESPNNRFNPTRPAPSIPTDRSRQQPAGSLRQMTAQRPAPSAPQSNAPTSNGPRAGENLNGQGSLRSAPRPDVSRQPTADRYGADKRPNVNSPGLPPSRLPAPVQAVKPLNITNKAIGGQTKAVPDGVRQAEAALSKKADPRHKDVRMSTMSEGEVMERLRQVVSKDNPNESYSKQRKIGQGASGSVYVARIKETATSSIARELYRTHGPRAQVAIKQMDLKSQPRKELIVNEIIVMKDSQHPNIVNFLDSFLQEQNNELWVVMEYMEGGPLTDVIDNNPVINEDQIATICYEVSLYSSPEI